MINIMQLPQTEHERAAWRAETIALCDRPKLLADIDARGVCDVCGYEPGQS